MVQVAAVRGFGTRTAPRVRGLAIALVAGLFAAMAVALTTPVFAQEIPTRINYQGRLTNENGDPIDNASVTMSFSLYDAPSGGAKQWPASGTEDHTVNVSDGLFNVILGSIDALTLPSFSDSLFLNIEVNDGSGLETLSPRQPLVSAPYAFRAGIAETVDNGAAADVDLKRNGATKLTLTSSGITVTGTLAISGNQIADAGAAALTFDGSGNTTIPAGRTLNVTTAGNLRVAGAQITSAALSDGVGAGTGNTFTVGQTVDGTADQIQLTVQGHSTQTSNVLVVENSAGTDLATVDNSGNLVVTGTADLQGNILDSGGDVTINDNLAVTGTSDLQGNVSNSAGDVTVGDNLAVTGTSDLQGNVSNSTGVVTVGDNFAVTGTSDLQGNISDSGGDVTIADNLAVTGTSDLQGNISDSGGDVTIADNLAVTGTSDLQGNISDSGGDVTIADNLTVTNDLTVSGTAATLPANSIDGSEASASLRTKVTSTAIGNVGGTVNNYIFIAPTACTITAIKLVTSNTEGPDNANYYLMQVVNVTQTLNLLANAKNTSNGAAANFEGTTAGQAYDFGTLQNATLAADDVLQLQITIGAGGPGTLNKTAVFVFYEVTG